MPNVRAVMDGLRTQIVNCLAAIPGLVLTGPNPNVIVAPGWPSVTTLQKIPVGGPTVINIYDHSHSKDVTRFMPCLSNEIAVPSYLHGTFDKAVVAPGGLATFTLTSDTNPLTVGNAVSLIVNCGLKYAGEAVTVGATDTLATMCTALAALLSANQQLPSWATFVAASNTIVITNIATVPISLVSYAGSFSTFQIEVHREIRYMQVNVWAASDAIRDQVSEPLDSLFAYLQANYGFQVGTEWVRVMHEGDLFMEDDILRDVYRRMFLINIEEGTTYNQDAYSVLVPIATLEALRADTQ